MQGRWNFGEPSKHGDYGVFVGLDEDSNHVILKECNEYGECFVVIHDNTEHGLSVDERHRIAIASANQMIYWNDIDCYHWMFDFKVGEHWCEALFGEDVMAQFHQDNPFDVLNVNVYE